jgi:S-(hydroxymethyl)mycothiol dehydrogenase
VNSSAGDPVEAVRELTGGRGVEFAFSAIGQKRGLTQAIQMCAYAGTATLVGMPKPGKKLHADLFADIFSPKVTIAVTHGGDTIPQEDFPFLAQAALDGRIDLGRFVTSTISLDEVPERLPRIGERSEIRTVALF